MAPPRSGHADAWCMAGPPRPNAGKLAAQAWLGARALFAPTLTPWHVEISLGITDEPVTPQLDEARDTRFRIEIYSEEWGVFFCHAGQSSWIRVTDVAFVHRRDDFKLLTRMPALRNVGILLHWIELEHGLRFRRNKALVRSNVPKALVAAQQWLVTL